eukprot:4775291-Prymnesium_polylepis.1
MRMLRDVFMEAINNDEAPITVGKAKSLEDYRKGRTQLNVGTARMDEEAYSRFLRKVHDFPLNDRFRLFAKRKFEVFTHVLDVQDYSGGESVANGAEDGISFEQFQLYMVLTHTTRTHPPRTVGLAGTLAERSSDWRACALQRP